MKCCEWDRLGQLWAEPLALACEAGQASGGPRGLHSDMEEEASHTVVPSLSYTLGHEGCFMLQLRVKKREGNKPGWLGQFSSLTTLVKGLGA